MKYAVPAAMDAAGTQIQRPDFIEWQPSPEVTSIQEMDRSDQRFYIFRAK